MKHRIRMAAHCSTYCLPRFDIHRITDARSKCLVEKLEQLHLAISYGKFMVHHASIPGSYDEFSRQDCMVFSKEGWVLISEAPLKFRGWRCFVRYLSKWWSRGMLLRCWREFKYTRGRCNHIKLLYDIPAENVLEEGISSACFLLMPL